MKLIKLFFAVVLFFTFSNVLADDMVSLKDKDGNDLTVAPGETVDMYLFIDYSSVDIDPGDFASIDGSSGLIQSGEIGISLPEGFEFVGTPVYVDGVVASPSDAKIDGSNGAYMISSADFEGCVYYIKKGALIKFQIKASTATASEEPYKGQIYNFMLTDGGWNSLYAVEGGTDEPLSFNIYVKEATAETEKVTLTKKYNTYVPAKALDFSSVEGLTAYYVTAVTATEATLTPATTVAAGEGIILEGTAGTEYDVPVASGEVTANSANLLATGTIAEGDYILYDGQFVLCTGGTLPDGKAYLPKSAISTSSAKALILGFGDATGINKAKAAKAEGAIYSISGVRVAQPQKGVYIMNGRKVIVK